MFYSSVFKFLIFQISLKERLRVFHIDTTHVFVSVV